jgi:hypothetical protein
MGSPANYLWWAAKECANRKRRRWMRESRVAVVPQTPQTATTMGATGGIGYGANAALKDRVVD